MGAFRQDPDVGGEGVEQDLLRAFMQHQEEHADMVIVEMRNPFPRACTLHDVGLQHLHPRDVHRVTTCGGIVFHDLGYGAAGMRYNTYKGVLGPKLGVAECLRAGQLVDIAIETSEGTMPRQACKG